MNLEDNMRQNFEADPADGASVSSYARRITYLLNKYSEENYGKYDYSKKGGAKK